MLIPLVGHRKGRIFGRVRATVCFEGTLFMRWLQTTTAPSIGTTFDHRTQRGAAAGGRAESPLSRDSGVWCCSSGSWGAKRAHAFETEKDYDHNDARGALRNKMKVLCIEKDTS